MARLAVHLQGLSISYLLLFIPQIHHNAHDLQTSMHVIYLGNGLPALQYDTSIYLVHPILATKKYRSHSLRRRICTWKWFVSLLNLVVRLCQGELAYPRDTSWRSKSMTLPRAWIQLSLILCFQLAFHSLLLGSLHLYGTLTLLVFPSYRHRISQSIYDLALRFLQMSQSLQLPCTS